MDSSVHVTAVITHRVRPGREPGYDEWIKGIATDALSFEGYLGAQIIRPELGVSPDHVIVLQFDPCPHLESWLQSESRKDLIERVKPLIRKPESIKLLTGLEPWFQLPGQPIHTAPKRYKQANLAWIGVVGVSLMLSPHVSGLLTSWPCILRLLVNMGITVALLSYWVMRSLTPYSGSGLFQ